MTDAGAGEPQALFQLLYRSRSRIADDERKTALGEIFTSARRRNALLGVTGALVISDDAFVQALEGDEAVVRELYATIADDSRHADVTVLKEAPAQQRTFGRWAMARVADDGGADIRLLSNATKGVIVAAPGTDRSITADQETVLAYMRDALARDHA